MKVVLDTNCIIDAVSPEAHAYVALQVILGAFNSRKLELMGSRHSLNELSRPGTALHLAQKLQILHHYPIGALDNQVATWKELAGTWDNARSNQGIQRELAGLAKAGNDIRDRGAYIDALHGGADAFVTSDLQFADSGPAHRIQSRFGLRVVTPHDLASEVQGSDHSGNRQSVV